MVEAAVVTDEITDLKLWCFSGSSKYQVQATAVTELELFGRGWCSA